MRLPHWVDLSLEAGIPENRHELGSQIWKAFESLESVLWKSNSSSEFADLQEFCISLPRDFFSSTLRTMCIYIYIFFFCSL